MADRRKTQKNHIRAARDWLGQAEHLLDHENDVQGDLKLMLARAELSKVQESPRGTWFRCWGLRLVPALLALVIAAGGGLFWHQWQQSDVSATSREAVLAGEHKSAEESPTGAVEAPAQQTQPKPQSSASAMPASTARMRCNGRAFMRRRPRHRLCRGWRPRAMWPPWGRASAAGSWGMRSVRCCPVAAMPNMR